MTSSGTSSAWDGERLSDTARRPADESDLTQREDALLRILVVEDDEDDQFLIRDLLHNADQPVELTTVTRLAAALERIRSRTFDLVLLDLDRVGSRGEESLARLVDQAPDLPVVILTGAGDLHSAGRLLRRGAQDCLAKEGLSGHALWRAMFQAMDRKAFEREPRDQQRFLQHTLDALTEHIAILDESGDIIAVNQAWHRFGEENGGAPSCLGVGVNYLAVTEAANGAEAEYGRRAADGLRRMLSGELASFSMEYPCHSPTEKRWFSLLVTAFEHRGRRRLVVAHQNVSLLKRVAAHQRILASAFSASPDGVLLLDRDGRIEFANDAIQPLLRRPDGSRIEQVQELRDPGDPPGMSPEVLFARARREGEAVRAQYDQRMPDGDRRRISGVVTPVADEQGNLVAYVLAAKDITQEIELQKQVFEAQKMQAVGRLAGGIAHDFNNILQIVVSYLEFLDLELREAELGDGAAGLAELHEDLSAVTDSCARGAQLIRQLLTFSRAEQGRPAPVDLGELIRRLEKMLRKLVGESVRVDLALEPRATEVRVDPVEAEQVILNLVVNAKDALEDGGTLELATELVELTEPSIGTTAPLPPGAYLQLTVADTGSGMTDEVRARIFEPFFSTKEVGSGTGLGLATVYGIVHQAGGALAVDTAPGRGTAMRVLWPLAAAGEAQRSEPVEATAPIRGTETLLLVEDEPALRKTMSRMLTAAGYRVIEARNGAEALHLAHQSAPRIDLVLTDVVMPLMSGTELASRLLAAGKAPRVLFMSGYSGLDPADLGLPARTAPLLHKPFSRQQLLETIRRLLDEVHP